MIPSCFKPAPLLGQWGRFAGHQLRKVGAVEQGAATERPGLRMHRVIVGCSEIIPAILAAHGEME